MIESNLKEIQGNPNEVIHVEGKEEPGDGGGGYFIWDEGPKEEGNTWEVPIDDYREESEYILEPIIEELTPYNLYEHQPLDYYKYGEYPRFQMPIVNRCRYKTIRKNKMIAYKLFRKLKSNELAPLFINKKQRIPLGVWLNAECHPTKGFSLRPGWHCTNKPEAPHLSMKGRIWVEVEIEDYKEIHRPINQGGLWYLANRLKAIREI